MFLGGKDSIINARLVHSYLQAKDEGERDEGKYINTQSKAIQENYASRNEVPETGHGGDGCLSVVWCENLDHGQVFDLPIWRKRLEDEILTRAEQGRSPAKV